MRQLFHEFIDHIMKKQYMQHSLITRIFQIHFLSMDIYLLPNSWKNVAIEHYQEIY